VSTAEAMLVHQLLERSAHATPHAPAVFDIAGEMTFGELDALANRFANVCIQRGVQQGDRVVLAIDNSIALVAAYFGVMKAGAVAVPLPPGARSDRLAVAVRDCSPSFGIIDGATRRLVESSSDLSGMSWFTVDSRRRWQVTADDSMWSTLAAASSDSPAMAMDSTQLAAIIYTSGSTGTPRGVTLTHRNIIENTRAIVTFLELTARDRVMCVLPLCHVYGLSLLHTHVMVGGSVVLENRFIYPNLVLHAMRDHQVTGFAGVPSTFAFLLHRSELERTSLDHLRYITQAGGAMPRAHILKWLATVPHVPLYVMYGATEAAARLTYLPPSELSRKLGSIGKAIPGVQIRVVADDGAPAEPGEIGELVARGANISPGYWKDPQETRARFGPDGFRTGDLGYVDEDGFLFLVGRRHEMLKVGGHRVGPKEVEDILHQSSAVHEAAVVGRSDELLGQVPIAFVTLRGGHQKDENALRAFCAERLSPYKVPVRIVICPDLPRSGAAGKVDKLALRQRAASASSW